MDIKVLLEWIKHFFWLIGWITYCLLMLDGSNAKDTYFWLKIHLTCKFGISDKKVEISIRQKFINFSVILLGVISSLFISTFVLFILGIKIM